MNRLNPLYIVALLLTLLLMLLWQNHKIRQSIDMRQKEIYRLQEQGQKLTALKNYWGEEKQKARVEQFIQFAKKYVAKKEPHGTSITIRLDNLKSRNSDRVASKLLNSFIIIKNLSIKRKDKEEISMETELLY